MTYEVQLDGMAPVTATAGNRKAAEQQAATMLLEQIIASPQQEKGKTGS
jgi:dsRNA-specific ribonuclease